MPAEPPGKCPWPGGAILALLKAPRPPGRNGFGRVILETPGARTLGELEGNAIELHTPPEP